VRLLTSILLLANLSFADTIAFRDGRTIKGSYLGGDARTVKVAIGDRVESYAVADITNIWFDGSTATGSAPGFQPNYPNDARDRTGNIASLVIAMPATNLLLLHLLPSSAKLRMSPGRCGAPTRD